MQVCSLQLWPAVSITAGPHPAGIRCDRNGVRGVAYCLVATSAAQPMGRIPMRIRVSQLLLWVGGLGLALAAAANGPASFVAGDLIVKFTDASEAGALVARAVRDEPAATAQLSTLAARLSAELGVGMTAARVTSGRELVLSIDREQLLARLAQRVQRDPAVTGVTPLAGPKTVLPPATIALVVEFAPGSDGYRLLQRAARAGERRNRDIDALVAGLTAGADPQPAGQANERGQLVLAVDVAALTRDLVERLKRRADVEYAQLSQVVRPFDRSRE